MPAEIRAKYGQLHAGFGFAAARCPGLSRGAGYQPPLTVRLTSELLAQAPSAIIADTRDDALAIQRRPNLPGAPASSWSLALSERLDSLARARHCGKLAAALVR